MKNEMSFINPEAFEVLKEMGKGVTFEHFGAREQSEALETTESSENVFGNPEKDAESWHRQSEPMSCAISCQEFVAEQLTGREFDEKDLINYAEQKNWYTYNDGTMTYDVGNLLEAMGIKVERAENLTLNDLKESLDDGEKIICSVNNKVLDNPLYSLIPGMRANHAVQVTGIDASNPNKPEIILNDPGVEGGKGRRVDAETFLKAWNTGGNFAAIAGK